MISKPTESLHYFHQVLYLELCNRKGQVVTGLADGAHRSENGAQCTFVHHHAVIAFPLGAFAL